jgi:FkbM family methyltransferase
VAHALAKKAITEFAGILPARARRVLLRELCEVVSSAEAYEVFQKLGRRFGIEDMRIPGELGLIEGALADTAILASYAQTRCWAPSLVRIVEEFFDGHGTGTYIDIGANIGLTTIPVARRSWVACKAFEADPQTFGYLQQNLRQNCTTGNVEAFNLALSDRRGTVGFELADDNLGDNRIRLTDADGSFGEAARRVIHVSTDRLDNVLSAGTLIPPIGAKIDTQGAECRIVEGGQAVLATASILAFEFWPYGIRRMASRPDSLLEFIASRFSSGTTFFSEIDEAPHWQPLGTLVEHLRAFANASGDKPYATCDVVVRR